MKNITEFSATDLLGLFALSMATAIKSGQSYEAFAKNIQQRYTINPAQWGFLIDLWELTNAASVEIHIERLNEAR
jgi:hypothetical protein